MFVVRIENDEATVFRAFRHSQSAKRWAVERDDDHMQSAIDIFAVPSADDSEGAVSAVREGRGTPVRNADGFTAKPPLAMAHIVNAGADHAFA
ncbi:hypothetical protein [Aureimonas psammosilenae]|uniref:hypothetical protein n=1 Tax=Aureimonas psammosilenae TaxID=2495496 RepID=UPI00126115D1|nr:hypothetical protein [Aureimonas psammosilenae]